MDWVTFEVDGLYPRALYRARHLAKAGEVVYLSDLEVEQRREGRAEWDPVWSRRVRLRALSVLGLDHGARRGETP